jgi:hypothetical protein
MHSLLTTTTLLIIPTIHASTTILDIIPLLQQPTTHAPWSHEPHCTTSQALTHLGQTFCVYTSNTTGPYGLSFISTPTAAREVTNHLHANPIVHFLTPSQAKALYLHPPPWKVVDIPGKNKGVVATRRIQQYETFMLDQAAVVMDVEVEKALGRKGVSELLKMGVERLYMPGMVWDMSRAHAGKRKGEEGGEETLEQGIMQANAFGSDVVGVKTRVLFPLVSVRYTAQI